MQATNICPVNGLWASYLVPQDNGKKMRQSFKVVGMAIHNNGECQLLEIIDAGLGFVGDACEVYSFPFVDGKPATEEEWIEDQKNEWTGFKI